ncbi:MAG: hypothetical protein NVS4B8_22710 [Herpetosiphon sp.]
MQNDNRKAIATLPLHQVVPNWHLADRYGRAWSLRKPHAVAHTLLSVSGDQPEVVEWLHMVAPTVQKLRHLPARGVAVVAGMSAVDVPPWTVLVDVDGVVRQRFGVPEGGTGVFILDRYNELYHQWIALTAASLPNGDEVAAWLEAVAMQCRV